MRAYFYQNEYFINKTVHIRNERSKALNRTEKMAETKQQTTTNIYMYRGEIEHSVCGFGVTKYIVFVHIWTV